MLIPSSFFLVLLAFQWEEVHPTAIIHTINQKAVAQPWAERKIFHEAIPLELNVMPPEPRRGATL